MKARESGDLNEKTSVSRVVALEYELNMILNWIWGFELDLGQWRVPEWQKWMFFK